MITFVCGPVLAVSSVAASEGQRYIIEDVFGGVRSDQRERKT